MLKLYVALNVLFIPTFYLQISKYIILYYFYIVLDMYFLNMYLLLFILLIIEK